MSCRLLTLCVRRCRGRDHARQPAAGPAREASRNRLVLLDHLAESVEALAHQHVRVVGDRTGQSLVSDGLGLRRLLALDCDSRLRDCRLVGIDLLLRCVVEADDRHDDVEDLHLLADGGAQVGFHLPGQRVKRVLAGGSAVQVTQRVVARQHVVESLVQLARHQAVANVFEPAVVAEQLVCGVLHDPPAHRVVNAGHRLVADAHAGAPHRIAAVDVVVRLDGRVELDGLGPGRLDVQAVAQCADRLAEAGHHADLLGADDGERAQ